MWVEKKDISPAVVIKKSLSLSSTSSSATGGARVKITQSSGNCSRGYLHVCVISAMRWPGPRVEHSQVCVCVCMCV